MTNPTAILFLAGSMLALSANAQTSDCRLRGADTVINTGATYKKCLDLSALDNKTVIIPANVTRIDNTGFALCESSESQGGDADIVYVMDQSGSMGINYVWVSPNEKDTIFLQDIGGSCNIQNADIGSFGSMTIPRDAGVRTIPKINPAKTPTNCTSTSGDPYTQRGIAFKGAIDVQAARAPNSTAGFIGFAESIVGQVAPLKLNSTANIARIKASMNPALVGGTNYTVGLDQSKKWLLQPAFTSNPTKAVIFLSDGRPTTDSAGIAKVLSATYPAQPGVMPPVYGIFMGQPTTDTTRLADLSRSTGGKFFLIPPSRPDSLKAVVEGILNVILRQFRPSGTVVTNSSTVPTGIGTAGPTNFARQDDGSWLITFDKIVSLKPQTSNQISLKTELVDQTGTTKPRTVNFILSTTGPDESTNKNLPGTQFSVACVDLPPPLNPVKVAYIKDTDGDGAGDMVFFVFTRPLAALPATIDPIYWNDFGDAFKNKGVPKLSFLVGSGNTVVVADLTATPYPVGLTSVPPGGAPIAVLPAGGVFGGQRPPISDSIGPIIMTANVHPFDISKVQPGGDLNLDTITITTSEPIRSNQAWNTVLLWSKPDANGNCTDYAHATVIKTNGQPVIDAGMTKVTLTVPTIDAATPVKGDCVYLNVDGTYTDLHFNIPPVNGRPLDGIARPRRIELFRGFPPVVGISADQPGFIVINNDPRKGDRNDYSQTDPVTGKYVTVWVPPVGFVVGQPFAPIIPGKVDAPSVGADPTIPTALPKDLSTVQVVATGKYIADVGIFDSHGGFVRKFRQPFGYQGEMNNGTRTALRGQVSYLVWDMKDFRGQKAGQGVYIWKVAFRFENGKQEIQYTKTGILRRALWSATR